MDLFQIIALLFPAAVATTIYLSKTEKRKVNSLLIYMNYTTIINLLNYIILFFIFEQNALTFTVLFSIKYISLAIVNAIIISFLTIFITKNITLNIEHKRKNK